MTGRYTVARRTAPVDDRCGLSRTVHPRIAALDLSEEQAIALNSWSYFGGPMPDVLTDEQKRQLEDR